MTSDARSADEIKAARAELDRHMAAAIAEIRSGVDALNRIGALTRPQTDLYYDLHDALQTARRSLNGASARLDVDW